MENLIYNPGKGYRMVVKRGRGRRLRLAPKNRQYKGKKTAALSKPMRRAIKQVINRQQERKYRCESYMKQLNAVASATTNELFPLIPQTQMAGSSVMASSSTRIGQKLTCARAYSDIHVSFNAGVQGSKDLIVKLWLLTSREFKNMDDILAFGSSTGARPLPIRFLDDGNGGTQSLTGIFQDLDLPVATDEWTPLKIYTFRLSKSSGVLQNNSNPYTAVNPAAYIGTGAEVHRHFRFYHDSPKVWNYSGDVVASYPNNYAPVWALTYVYADGTTPQAANIDVQVNVTNHLEFYDA